MRQSLILILLLLTIAPCVSAQKKEIAQARLLVKGKKDLDKAAASMRQLLEKPENKDNIKIYLTLAEAIKAKYELGNEKLYLKEKYDTAALFGTARDMFLAFETLDSIDAQPDKKGRVKIKFRKKNASFLNAYRTNLFNGGMFFIRKHQYATAFDMLDTYLDCIRQPLFEQYNYGWDDKRTLAAAYRTLYCGYKMNDTVRAMKYVDKALQFKPGRENALQYVAEIYKAKGETENYLATLYEGFEEYRKSVYFVSRLVDYHNDRNQLDSSLVIVNKALDGDSANVLLKYVKSSILLNSGDYDQCISLCKEIIAVNDSMPDVYYNAGVAYINKAFLPEKEKNQNRKIKSKIIEYYKQAKPFMEKYRVMMPEREDRWSAALYNIYLNLNMGKEFEEIEDILRK